MKLKFILLTAFFSVTAEAQVLSTFVREQVGTLPRGRFMVSYMNVDASIDSMFGPGGELKTLSSNLSQEVTFQTIVQQDPVRGNQLAGLFSANGVNLSSSAGAVSGSISGTVKGRVPVIGYGITDQVGVFLTLPVLTFSVEAGYRFSPSSTTQAFLSRLSSNDQTSVANDMTAALNTSLESKLFNTGIAWDPRLNRSYFGDMQILFNVVLPRSKGSDLKQSFQPGIVLPTASDQDLHDLYGLKAGDRRFGLSLKYSLEKPLPYGFQFNLGVGGTYLLANTQGRRIPKDFSDELNELFDEQVSVSGGAKFQGQAQLRYSLPKWVSLNGGMSWQKRMQEELMGVQYSPILYQLASTRTGYDLLTAYASLDVNSIPSFLEGDFLFPAIAEVGVGLPVAGINAISEPVLQLQGTMFF